VFLRTIALLILGLSACSISSSTTYYVDSRRGNDSNDGTSPGAPWRSLAKLNSSHFSPGDSILLSRGSVWRESLNIPISGAPDRIVTVDAYGAGESPVISGSDLIAADSWTAVDSAKPNIWQAQATIQPNVLLFDGAKGHRKSRLSELSAPMDWFCEGFIIYIFSTQPPGAAYTHPGIESGTRPIGINLSGRAFISVKNITITGANAAPYTEGAGIWAITSHLEGPTPGDLNISNVTVYNGAGDGIHIENAEHCVIDSSVVHDNEGAGIELYHSNGKFPITSGRISNNDVHHNGYNGIFIIGCPRGQRCRSVVYPEGLIVTGLRIIGNRVHDNGAGIYIHQTNGSLVAGNVAYANTNTSHHGEGYCVGISGSSSNIIEKNECYQSRLSAIELSIDIGKPPFGSSDNVIRYNVIHDDGAHGIFTNYVPSQHNKILYNLIYNHPHGSCIMANYVGHEIYNNTCYNNRIGLHLYVSASTRETGNISVKNNLFARDEVAHVVVEKEVDGPFDFSNNLYDADGGAEFIWRGSNMNFSQWRATTGLDRDSVIADPQFSVSSPGRPADFVLAPTSPALGRGLDLGSDNHLALSSSVWPNQIVLVAQQPGRWDIGALRRTR